MLVEAALGLVNRVLADEGWPLAKLKKFAGQSILVVLGTRHFLLQISRKGLLKSGSIQQPPEVTITLPSDVLLCVPGERNALLSTARISGPAEFAECLNQVFRNLTWDIESSLSPLCGDILAHRLVRFGQTLSLRQQDFFSRLAQNLGEFVLEEKTLIARRRSLSAFSRDLDELRKNSDSLEKRLGLLERFTDA